MDEVKGRKWVHCLFLFPLLAPCVRENVNVTCKIVSFLCSLDNFLLKNTIVSFFGNQISKWHPFEKRAIWTYFTQFLVTREKTKILSAHIPLTYMYFAHRIDFFAFPILQTLIANLSCMVNSFALLV